MITPLISGSASSVMISAEPDRLSGSCCYERLNRCRVVLMPCHANDP
jgi:hypothetical protein